MSSCYENGFPSLALSGAGVASGLEVELPNFLAALSNNETCIQNHASLESCDSSALLFAPIASLRDRESQGRLYYLLKKSLTACIKTLPDTIHPRRIYLHSFLPSRESARSSIINAVTLRSLLALLPSPISEMHYGFSSVDEGFGSIVDALLEKLMEHEYDAVILGGVDSLINPETYEELSLKEKIRTNTYTEGVTPGEAGAYLALRRIEDAPKNFLICWHHDNSSTGIEDLIIDLHDFYGSPLDKMHEIYIANGDPCYFPADWYTVTQNLGLARKCMGINIPKAISLENNLGNVGAASLALTLLVAYERLKRKENQNAFICDMSKDSKGVFLVAKELCHDEFGGQLFNK